MQQQQLSSCLLFCALCAICALYVCIQVLHYGKDEEYQTHYDFYFDEISLRNGGQRVATIVMYLSTVEEGEPVVTTWFIFDH